MGSHGIRIWEKKDMDHIDCARCGAEIEKPSAYELGQTWVCEGCAYEPPLLTRAQIENLHEGDFGPPSSEGPATDQ
jgi:predicted RNA-binding Zn-ribbon protein involved in translation (DUF1610 family)